MHNYYYHCLTSNIVLHRLNLLIVVIFLEGKFVKNTSGVIERCGEGKHTFASGMVYSGKWEKDKMNGKGRHCSWIECNACTCTSADSIKHNHE